MDLLSRHVYDNVPYQDLLSRNVLDLATRMFSSPPEGGIIQSVITNIKNLAQDTSLAIRPIAVEPYCQAGVCPNSWLKLFAYTDI